MGWRQFIAELIDVPDVAISSPAEGDMIYFDGSDWVKVGGTLADGKAPMVQADGSVQWETSGGGGRTLLDSATLASDGSIDISSISGAHQDLILYIWGRSAGTSAGDGIEIQVGNTSIDTGSNYSWYYRERGSSASEDEGGDDTSISTDGTTPAGSPFTATAGDAGHYGFVVVHFYGYADASFHRFVEYTGFRRAGSSNIRRIHGSGVWQNTSDAIDEIKVTPRSTTDFKSGSAWELYGV